MDDRLATVSKDWDNKTALSYFQNKMMNLADSLKEQMGTMMHQSKVERVAANKMPDARQARNYEMPKKPATEAKQPEPALDERVLRASSNQYKRDRSGSNNGKRPPVAEERKETQYFNKPV